MSPQFHLLFQRLPLMPVLHRLLLALCRYNLTAPCFKPVLWTPGSGSRVCWSGSKGFQWEPFGIQYGTHNLETRLWSSLGPPLSTERQELMEKCFSHFDPRVSHSEAYLRWLKSSYRIQQRACSVASAVSNSLWPHGLKPLGLLCPLWVAISSSWGSFQPSDWTHISYVSCIGRPILYH